MSGAKWTPWPWTVNQIWSQTSGDGFSICEQRGGEDSPEAAANAQLIAAAPDLYEALALYVSRGHHDTCQHALSAEYPCNCGHYAAVRSLSKARGEA